MTVTNSTGIATQFPDNDQTHQVLTPQALSFLAALHRNFDARRLDLLAARMARQTRIAAGELPDFLPQTKHIRDADWSVRSAPADLKRRNVEITGPVDRKMIINALNSGANCFMADFEDSNSPTRDNNIQGHVNLRDAINRTISFENPDGKQYKLAEHTATLIVRPRGWHLNEKNMTVDGAQISGSLFDFGLYFFHNVAELVRRGSGPYFYLPKMESHLEARLWHDVFVFAEDTIGVPRGSIAVTALIETILAAFEEDEILYELREHIVGLNCGRWDYIFSYIKKLATYKAYILPDRAQVTMTSPFMRAYALNTIKTCHRRGAYAIGGMAAQIPIKGDSSANEVALSKVRADKLREVTDGHDGTWVAHPGLVGIAAEQFAAMKTENQIARKREDVSVTSADLLKPQEGLITETGVRTNISVGVQYMDAWLRGNGCVPLYNLMEDAATAEISRAQLWQWVFHQAPLADGRKLTSELFDHIMDDVLVKLGAELGPERCERAEFRSASVLFRDMTKRPVFDEFLTLEAYKLIN